MHRLARVRNVQINSYRNVIAVNRAVSDRQTKTRLHLSEDNSGDHRIYDSNDGRRSVEVKCIALDSYFRRYTRPIDFIKMDMFGCRDYYQVHVSGHAPAGDIRRIVEAATPDLLVPIHTRFPETFGHWHDNVLSDVQVGAGVIIH